ncbi:MAG: hypothetical protein ACXVH5_08500, partial [Ilumatobacteraceae bacterium]
MPLRALPELGRNLVVRPGRTTPAGWSAARRLAITKSDLGDPTPLIAQLTHLAANREPCVFEIDASIDPVLSALQTNATALHVVGPRFTFELSTLSHLLWSNSIDARDPELVRWPLV